MTVPFQKRFVALAAARSPLCVGIDPSADSLKGWGLPDDAEGLRTFCERMVEVCAPLVACVKPQSAFFERHGPAERFWRRCHDAQRLSRLRFPGADRRTRAAQGCRALRCGVLVESGRARVA